MSGGPWMNENFNQNGVAIYLSKQVILTKINYRFKRESGGWLKAIFVLYQEQLEIQIDNKMWMKIVNETLSFKFLPWTISVSLVVKTNPLKENSDSIFIQECIFNTKSIKSESI